MKKDIAYLFNSNGLFFDFDFITRSGSILSFYSHDHCIATLCLFDSSLVFDRKVNNIYAFKLVPVRGADDGK